MQQLAIFLPSVCWAPARGGARSGFSQPARRHWIRCLMHKCPCPPRVLGGTGLCCVCSAVSYFSTLLGSIIGAGRLSFRVRDGSGRFPVAITAVTLFKFVIGGGVSWFALLGLVVACV